MLVRKLTKEERVIVHKLATEFDLKHESIGKWRRMILYIYKDQLTLSIQRNSQVICSSLNSIAESSQLSNQNVADVITKFLEKFNCTILLVPIRLLSFD